MGGFSRVEIHFQDSAQPPQNRIAVIDRMSFQIDAIFLRGAEKRFVLTEKGQTEPITREDTDVAPEGVTLLPKGGIIEGPGEVRYLENGVLKCWNPT